MMICMRAARKWMRLRSDSLCYNWMRIEKGKVHFSSDSVGKKKKVVRT